MAAKKEITILSGSSRLLGKLQAQKPGQNAQQMLEKMGVTVTHNVQVKSVEKVGNKMVLQLSNGETKTVDVYIGATGDKPNSEFVPKEWLNERNKVLTDEHTLRVTAPNATGVYCCGTVGSYSDGSIMDTKMGYTACVESIRLDLDGQGNCKHLLPLFAHTNRSIDHGARTKKIYKKFKSEVQIVPVGSQQGVGIAFGWGLPSFMIKMAKSKDFMIGNASKLIQGQA